MILFWQTLRNVQIIGQLSLYQQDKTTKVQETRKTLLCKFDARSKDENANEGFPCWIRWKMMESD